MKGVVYLTNGKSFEGKISINKGSFVSNPVKVYAEGDKKPMQFDLRDVKAYEINGDYYALKEIKGGVIIGHRYSFMERLTPENSRIHLYENVEKVTTRTRYGTTTHYETEYYMELPGTDDDNVWAVNSSKFVPNFDEKMSKLLSDCPMLARKIANQEEGYFYRQISMFKEKRANVLLNIIEEYNRCR